MMTPAYNEMYLNDAMNTLGSALEHATINCNLNGQDFIDFFIISGIANEFEKGNIKYISGMSGIELSYTVQKKCGLDDHISFEVEYIDYPPQYWAGWILAYYQWFSGFSFKKIRKHISFETLINLYGVLHESTPEKAAVVLDNIIKKPIETNLAKMRKSRDLSQSQLAKASDISFRSIQLFEQQRNNINKAGYNHLLSIAKALNCTIDDIIE